MTIEFVSLDGFTVEGHGTAELALRSRGLGQEVGAGGAALLGLHATGTAQVYYGGGIDPPVPANGSALVTFAGRGAGYDRSFGSGSDTLSIRTQGYAAKPNQGAGMAAVAFNAVGRELKAAAAFAGLQERPAMISGFGGRWFISPRSSVSLGSNEASLPTHVLQEVLALDVRRRSNLLASSAVSDGLTFEDMLAVVYLVLLQEGVAFSPSPQADSQALERTVDRLLLMGVATSYGDAVNAVIGGIWFGALTEALRTETVVDSLMTSAVVEGLQQAAELLVDQLLANAAGFGAGTGVVLVSETLVASPEVRAAAELVQLLRDGLGFVTRLSLDTGEYVAWVLNTDNRALSRYTNYPFNSFAKIGGRYYGAAADGLHRLEGDDDDGVPIAARIRMGLSALGTRRLKRVPEAFVGYASDGALFMQVITVNETTGEKEAAIYRILERPASSPRESRWKLGKGIKAVDFDFVIENAAGADFDLSAIEFRPIVLDRRTRG